MAPASCGRHQPPGVQRLSDWQDHGL